MENGEKLDQIDLRILRVLQRDAGLSQRELAEAVGMSQNACWRRLKALEEAGIIKGRSIRLDAKAVGLGLTVFVMVRTKHHSSDWLQTFRKEMMAIPNIVDFFRIAGDYDYMLKVVAEDMNDFDRVYQRMISKVELEAVTSHITMEAIVNNRDLPV